MNAMSLAGLRSKIDRLVTKDNTSSDITDNKTWMNTWIEKIQSQGNQPEDWLEYTQYMRDKHNHGFKDRIDKHNFLCEIYDKAFEEISQEKNKKNQAYARLFVEYSQVKRQFLPDEAKRILSHARAVVRRFAIVHVASAEMEMEEGNISKAKKIIEKAQLFEAEPESLLKDAVLKIKEGSTKLMSYDDLTGLQIRASGEINLHATDDRTANTTSDMSRARNSSGNSDTENIDGKSCDITDNTRDRFLNLKAKLGHSTKPPMRSYHSTPEIRDVKSNDTTSSAARWKRKNFVDIGAPLRVKKLNLPFKEEEENSDQEMGAENIDDNDTMASFRPLDPLANSTMYSTSVAHSSGYLSMVDYTIPLESEKSPVSITTNNYATLPIKDTVIKKPQITSPDIHMNIQSQLKDQKQSHLVAHPPPVQRIHSPVSHNGVKVVEPEPARQSQMIPPPQPIQQQSVAPGYKQVAVEPQPMPPVQSLAPHATPSHKNSLQTMSTPSTKGIVPSVPCTPSLQTQMEVLEVNGQQYAVLKLIGRGGSSKVYKVFDGDLKTKAIKVVKLDDADERTVNGYKNEISLLQRLQYCSRVIKLYDFEYNQEKNILYIVMEEGSDDFALVLKNLLKEDGKLSENLIKYYWEAMLKAVGALHKEGIIHSDLKPSNFILVGGILKLIDFGIAKSIQNDKTSVLTDTQVGTLNYMSPETITDTCGDFGSGSERGRPVYKIGTASDLWSLGCILYNMVYGYTPFQKYVKQFAKLRAIVDPDVPIQFKEIPDKHLLAVMKKCLTRDPKRRPTIDELLEHPYLTAGKEAAEDKEVKPNCDDKVLERLVKQLADKFAASPTGIRTLVKSAIKDENGSPIGELPINPFASQKVGSAVPSSLGMSQAKSTWPGVPSNESGGQSHMKGSAIASSSSSHVKQAQPAMVNISEGRAPLKCLSIQDIHSHPKFIRQNDPKS